MHSITHTPPVPIVPQVGTLPPIVAIDAWLCAKERQVLADGTSGRVTRDRLLRLMASQDPVALVTVTPAPCPVETDAAEAARIQHRALTRIRTAAANARAALIGAGQ
jgi:hypothetical protein